MSQIEVWFGLVAAYSIGILSENRRHNTNYFLLTSRGAVEKHGLLMKLYYLLPATVLIAAGAEFYFSDLKTSALHDPTSSVAALSTSMIFTGFLLRLWVLRTLGWQWTKRQLACNGFEKLKTGPYMIFSHPEYIARITEGLGFCLFLDSRAAAYGFLVISILFYFLVTRKEHAHLASYAQIRE